MAAERPKPESTYDDLTVIKGIGQNRQQWLREKLGVKTYTTMAALSAERVSASLKEDGQIVSQSDIESWIEQARDLASTTLPTPSAKVRAKGWQPFGSFVIEFQENKRTGERRTSAHHVEADRTEIWAGVEHHDLCRWMTQQIGEQEIETQTEETPLPPTKVEVEVDAVVSASPFVMAVEYQPETEQITENITQLVTPQNERLQQILAKASQLNLRKSGSPPLTSVANVSGGTLTQTRAIARQKSSTPEPKTQIGFSAELQSVLIKAQGLSLKKR